MKEKDNIKELFSEKLGNYEAKVDPQLWANISTQIGTTAGASAGGAGLSLLTKAIITAAAITGIVLTATYLIPSNADNKHTSTTTEKTPSSEQEQEVLNAETRDDRLETIIDQNSPIEATPHDNSQSEKADLPLDIYTEHLASDDDPANKIDFDPRLLPDTPLNNQSAEEGDNEVSYSEESSESEEAEKEEGTNSHKEESNQEDQEEAQETRTVITFKLPNIFNPSGSFNPYLTLDGANIENEVSLDELEDLQVVVLDSYSKVVFRSSDPYLKWDGTAMNGSPLPEGTYIIYLTATTKDKTPVNGSSQLYIQR